MRQPRLDAIVPLLPRRSSAPADRSAERRAAEFRPREQRARPRVDRRRALVSSRSGGLDPGAPASMTFASVSADRAVALRAREGMKTMRSSPLPRRDGLADERSLESAFRAHSRWS